MARQDLSVACGDTSPNRKGSLRPEGDVAASDRGRTTLGRPGNSTRQHGYKLTKKAGPCDRG